MFTFGPIELLSPAKDAAIGRMAIDHGADAVYIGGPAFGARFEASNRITEIEELAAYAHRFHARVYMTLNTLLFDDELEQARKIAWLAYEAGVDAMIVQDMGLLKMDLPPIDLHASTQCDIRSPLKAAFLDSLGFSQIVLARELSLEEIKACRSAAKRARLEYFVHGALCVSYSGQCYLSAYQCQRSANRGQCSQPCRLPYNVIDFKGHELFHKKHVLSLKDNDQSEHLKDLIEAGVSSFKIEGRLKDAAYVKNITAYYRKKLDRILEENGWESASLGKTVFEFEPDPKKTFHRGSTDYFYHGRQSNIASINTPKSVGESIGRVTSINRKAQTIDVEASEKIKLNNADGFVYFDGNGTLMGLAANRADQITRSTFRLSFYDSLKGHPDLAKGIRLFRNKDHAFLKVLNGHTARRVIPVDFVLRVSTNLLALKASVNGISASADEIVSLTTAKNPELTMNTVQKNLSRTGETEFAFNSLKTEGDPTLFIPTSVLNNLRRRVLAALSDQIIKNHIKHTLGARIPFEETIDFHNDYRLNVTNRLSRIFWSDYHLAPTENGFECENKENPKTELMRCRYCIRHELNLCPKQTKGNPKAKELFKKENGGHLKPEPLLLIGPKGEKFKASFDCKACEMTISQN